MTKKSSIEAVADAVFDGTLAALKADGVFPPMFMIGARDGQSYQLQIGWANEEQRVAAQITVALLCRALDARAMSFITEAWMTSRPTRDGPPPVPPSQSETRREVVMLSHASVRVDGEAATTHTRTREVVRDDSGAVIGLAAVDGYEGTSVGGDSWIADCLPIRPVPRGQQNEIRERLREMLDFKLTPVPRPS